MEKELLVRGGPPKSGVWGHPDIGRGQERGVWGQGVSPGCKFWAPLTPRPPFVPPQASSGRFISSTRDEVMPPEPPRDPPPGWGGPEAPRVGRGRRSPPPPDAKWGEGLCLPPPPLKIFFGVFPPPPRAFAVVCSVRGGAPE